MLPSIYNFFAFFYALKFFFIVFFSFGRLTLKNEEKTVKEVEMHKFLVCAKSEKFCAVE